MKKSELKSIIKEVIQESLPPTRIDILKKNFSKMRHAMTKKLAKDLVPQINEILKGRRMQTDSEHFTVKEVVDTEIEYDDRELVEIFAICIDNVGRKRRIFFTTMI